MADDKSKQDAKAEEEARLNEMKKIAGRMLAADKPQIETTAQARAPTIATPPSMPVPPRPAPVQPAALPPRPAPAEVKPQEAMKPMRPVPKPPFVPQQKVEYAGPAGARQKPGAAPAFYIAPPEKIVRSVAQRIMVSSPNLRQKLRLAGMNDDPLIFIQQSLVVAGMMSVMLTVLFFFVLQIFRINIFALVVLFPLFFIFSFMLRMQYPSSKAQKRGREVDRELVFAGRQMLIELKAGVPLFDAMLSISRDYGEISTEFAKIVDRVNAGVPTDVAMHDVAEDNPSMAFKRVMLQLINSIRSGSDVAKALGAVLDQVSREQITDLKAYGQKLNPLGMFYMVFGIILPSLGIALAIIIFSFLSINIDVTVLYAFLLVIAIVQYIFVTVMESQKPQYEF